MNLPVAICLLVISMPSIATAQGSREARTSLTRTQIAEAERQMGKLGYWTGAVDGIVDSASRSALIAFQKYEGRATTGKLTFDELEAIRTAGPPKARETGYAHVEVDLDRQVLMLVKEDGSVRALPTSTGNNKTFADEGQESIAYTPRGRFLVYAKEVGWQSGPLGATYYANFISGGVAIHGSRNVPERPASHGCIRIPMFAAREVSKLLKLGTIVLVYDKLSFVSAKDWVKDPKLKEAALASISAEVDYAVDPSALKSRSIGNRKALPRLTRS